MGDLVAGLVRLMLQLVLLAAGLVFAAGLLMVAALLAVVFGLRLLWARITGRPVIVRFGGMGVDPAASWRRYRSWQQQATRPRGRATQESAPGEPPPFSPPGAITQDVEDVQPKTPRH
ncbi:hypothetical protein [Pseudorhodoferax sp.]|uniref:hypothetical protein n=1 Tax=Pseudorhodoferax sp. TaxID=1993553 RepID=UPI002DD6238B|nr:hypothetical protein [Pseudorhodoferax sp.]